ncbi:hypothetical protein FA15DRAFT_760052 [Coprinopsis marcescibilis]|uniref:Fungal-type protein kinase domain-containing protein n=1 Tax=Coprinopsis marcescibilis TaxID=230819 RepID=A0A5C3KH68_COPMA|nr:hypothetical protein FA15DRAFT_760052 [Coprinopsis marcescibilis]
MDSSYSSSLELLDNEEPFYCDHNSSCHFCYCESMPSTPYHPRVGSFTDHRRAVIDPILHEELRGCVVKDVAVADFARHVFGLDEAVITKIMDLKWTLDKEKLVEYAQAADKDEKLMYIPFKELCQLFLSSVINKIEDDPAAGPDGQDTGAASVADIFWDGMGGETRVQHLHDVYRTTIRKPDGGMIKGPMPDFFVNNPVWNIFQRAFEFKRAKNYSAASVVQKGVAAYDAFNLPTEAPKPSAGTYISSVLGQSTTSLAFGPLVLENQNSNSKRKRTDEDVDPSPISSKRQCTVPLVATANTGKKPLVADKTQLAHYAIQCLSSSSRIWTTGLSINKLHVTVSYYDRMLLLQSVEVDIATQPSVFAVLLYAMYRSDRRGTAGYSPFLRPWSVLTPKEDITEEMQQMLQYPVEDFIGSFFEFPCVTEILEKNEQGEDVKKIIQVSNSFRIEEVLFAAQALTGRATIALGTKALLRAIAWMPRELVDLVLKISWQPEIEGRDAECDIIDHLHKKLGPEWHDHLPDVSFSAIYSPEDLNIPWLDIPDVRALLKEEKLSGYMRRSLHVIASRPCKKLWEVNNVDEFMKVWIDCVKCHNEAYEKGEVLHRDLSENNLMFWRKKIAESDSSSVEGVLNDWDMASKLKLKQVPKSAAKHRTGTLPFMAMEMLVQDPPAHLLRHDLESFFYILLWAAIHYQFPRMKNGTEIKEKGDDKEHITEKQERTNEEAGPAKTSNAPKFQARRPTPEALKRMSSMEMDIVLLWKSGLFGNNTASEQLWKVIGNHITPDFEAVYHGPLHCLYMLFCQGAGNHTVHLLETRANTSRVAKGLRPREAAAYDHSTMGGAVTYIEFMAALGIDVVSESDTGEDKDA